MLKKERMIVYPLLFLSLFSSLIGIGVLHANSTALERLEVRELVVVNEDGQKVIKLNPNDFGGSLSVFNNYGDEVAVLYTEDGIYTYTELRLRSPLDDKYSGISIAAYGDSRIFDNLGSPSYNISFSNGFDTYMSLDYSNKEASFELESGGNENNIKNKVYLTACDKSSDLMFVSFGTLEYYREIPWKSHLTASGSRTEGGSLNLYNHDGDDRASLYQSTAGHGGLWVYDKYGEESKGYTYTY
ncbi:MAG: hypothetical protein GX984_07095 [Erysipelothrix sp.]|nr:hypothetical protein [Erysipelothrix sp.]